MLEEPSISGKTAAEISTSIESAIYSGQLDAGARLPSVRRLAQELGASPATVFAAYGVLRQRGVLVTQKGSGTLVAPKKTVRAGAVAPMLAPGVRDLSNGSPDPALLPDLRRALTGATGRQLLYGEATINPELLRLALDQFADIGATEANLCFSAGAMDGVERLLQSRLRPNDLVAVEDPGYTGILDLVRALGLRLIGMRVDDEGIRAEELETVLNQGVQAVVVTPRAQNPTGAAITASRADSLREVLTRFPDVFVVENDHASAIAGVEHHSLTTDRATWAVVRSLSKSLGPDLRLAFVASDEVTRSRVEFRQQVGTGWISHILQEVATELLTDRATTALVARAKVAYEQHRRTMIARLADYGIEAHGASGLNVLIPVRDEATAIQAMQSRGWALRAGAIHRLQSPPFVRVTTAAMSPDDLESFTSDFAASLTPDRRSHTV